MSELVAQNVRVIVFHSASGKLDTRPMFQEAIKLGVLGPGVRLCTFQKLESDRCLLVPFNSESILSFRVTYSCDLIANRVRMC